MKKFLAILSVVVVALAIFGAGFVFAQTSAVNAAGLQAGFGPGAMPGGHGGMMGAGMGQMHEYVEQALADKLGINKTELQNALSNGKSMLQIVIDNGTPQADAAALLIEVHKTAFAKAVSDGIITQTQADAMLQNMTSNGFNFANCSQQNIGGAGRHGMMLAPGAGAGIGGGNQPQATTTP